MIKKINQKGLTILEVLVAIGIVSIIIGSVIVMVTRISNYSASAEVRSTAVNFAQEAIDIVKNVRDNQYCNFFSVAYPNSRYYRITLVGGVYGISPAGFVPLWESKFVAGSTAANATSGPLVPGGLRRSVRIDSVPGAPNPLEARRVTVETQWQTKGIDYAAYPSGAQFDSYKIVTDIYKWKY